MQTRSNNASQSKVPKLRSNDNVPDPPTYHRDAIAYCGIEVSCLDEARGRGIGAISATCQEGNVAHTDMGVRHRDPA